MKKITIALISNSSDELKRFSVPKYLLVLTTIFVIILGMYLGWVITDYEILKSKMPLLDKLQKENARQRIEFAELAQRIKQMTPKAGTVSDDDHKSNDLQNLKKVKAAQMVEVHDRNQPKPGFKPVGYPLGGGKPPQKPPQKSPNNAESPDQDFTPVLASARGNTTPQRTIRLPIKTSIASPDKGAVGLPDKINVGPPDKASNELPMGSHDGNTTLSEQNISTQEKVKQYPYSLQIGSYKTLKRADKAILIYQKKGLSPYWVKVDLGANGEWYRVFVGHFKNTETAKTFKQEKGVSGALIKKIAYANLIGIYSVEEQYEAEIKNLENNGYFPYVIKDEEGMLRLYVGAFFTREGAEKQYQDLTDKGIHSEIVKR